VSVRPATLLDAEAIAKVHVDSWRRTFRGIVPDEFLAQLSYAQRQQLWYQTLTEHGSRTVVDIAVDESDQVVGFASGGAERRGDPIYTAELYAIYLLAAHQGYGIGRHLVISVVNRLMRDGLTAVLVWGLAENPSRRFYERLGGRPVYEKTVMTGGVPLLEIGYGWQDVQLVRELGFDTVDAGGLAIARLIAPYAML
jgi:GNAT superfamily N-acetyltransferase